MIIKWHTNKHAYKWTMNGCLIVAIIAALSPQAWPAGIWISGIIETLAALIAAAVFFLSLPNPEPASISYQATQTYLSSAGRSVSGLMPIGYIVRASQVVIVCYSLVPTNLPTAVTTNTSHSHMQFSARAAHASTMLVAP